MNDLYSICKHHYLKIRAAPGWYGKRYIQIVEDTEDAIKDLIETLNR